MRAARIISYRDPLEVGQVPDPDCPADGVVLRTLACGICRSDWHAWTGSDPDVALPQIPGHEYCGEVVAVGSQVSGWQVGDRTIAPFILACGGCAECASGHQTACDRQIVPGFTAPGAFAEFVAVPRASQNLTALPPAMKPALAAAMGCRVTTAWQALTGPGALRAGEWLAIFGAGGVGLSALMLGRALGARVVVVDVVAEKLALARDLGAEHAINAATDDPVEAVRTATGGGAHLSVEALGAEVTTAASIACLRKRGRMVMVGMPAGAQASMQLPMDRVYAGQLAVYGTRGMPAWRYPSLLDALAATGTDLSPLIGREVALSDASAELGAFDGPAPAGVAVITDFAV